MRRPGDKRWTARLLTAGMQLAGARAPMLTRTRGRWLVECGVLAVLASYLGAWLGAARYGSPDSATYLNAAEHLARGDGYVSSVLSERGEFSAVACFAPLFSLLIALRMRLGQPDVLSAMADVVLASYALYGVACAALFRVMLPRTLRPAASALALGMLLWPASVVCLRSALSDLLGAALALLFCACLMREATTRRHWPAGLCLALALWARWANLYVFASACAALLLVRRQVRLNARLARIAVLSGWALLALGPLWLRNQLATQSLMGERPFLPSSVLEHSQRALLGLCRPLFDLLLQAPSIVQLGAGAVLFALVGGAVLALLRVRDERLDLSLGIALGSAGLLVLSASRTPYDALSHPRFWLGITPLLLALGLRAWAALLQAQATEGVPCSALATRRAWLAPACAALWLCLVAVQARGAPLRAQGAPRSGLLAERFASSFAVRTALALADANRCRLAATSAYWLLPQIGTRPVEWLELGAGRSTRVVQCVLLLREQVEYNTDSEAYQRRMANKARRAGARLLQRDALVELWWEEPDAQFALR